jgi:hypothetical protein
MAKSERKSKWKRKFRAIKREKNKKKELVMLNSILANKTTENSSEQKLVSEENPIGKKFENFRIFVYLHDNFSSRRTNANKRN